MAVHSMRSLLVAAILLSNYLAWTATRHHHPHNTQAPGAGLYLSASYVIPGGEGTGAWGEWGDVSPCSRSCGGGVASQKRICLEVSPYGQPLCTGGDTKYFSCETQDCPPNSGDFRSEQCSEYDDVAFRGIKYQWVPYTNAPKPCELNCMPRGERFYYRQKDKVIDGTRCNDESFDVCVNGACEEVGCDMMLGSNAREDKCRECRGNGTNCNTVTGIINTTDLRIGYNDVLLIPQGATSIVISEVSASNNYLALRSKQDNVYYLNGEYHIDFPRSLMIAGSLWHYERSMQGFAAPDKLRCLGPTTEPLYLSLLLQDNNVGIEYEYSVPLSVAPPPTQQYNWAYEDYSPCSASCGEVGIKTRNVTCRTRDDLDTVEDGLCDAAFKPDTNQTCNTDPCPARWVSTPWGPCSKVCGEGGIRSRQVYCEKIIINKFPSIVGDRECFELLGPKPELYQECNQNATCPTWFTGPWKPCDKLCGEGKQTRNVVCHQKENGKVQVFDDEMCPDEKPSTEQSCMLRPCDGVDWVLSEWSGCDTCTSKVQTRLAHCATKDHKVVDASFCAYHPEPVLEEPCDRTKLPSCEVLWYATQWSKCSVQCGKGVQSRRVFCGLFDGASVIKVDDSRCDINDKYNDTRPCEVHSEKCAAKWYAGPWSECTKNCGGGEQYRRVMCLSGGIEADACSEESILETLQSCNTEPCSKTATTAAVTSGDEDYEYEDCVEDGDYPEVGAEELLTLTGSTIFDTMFSDTTFMEGSGFGSTVITDSESEFTLDTGSGSEPTDSTLWSEDIGSGTTDTDITDTTDFTSVTVTESSTIDLYDELTYVFIPFKANASSSKTALPKSPSTTESVTESSTDNSSSTTEDTTSSTDSSSTSSSESTSDSSTSSSDGLSTDTSETDVTESVTDVSATGSDGTTDISETIDTESITETETSTTETSMSTKDLSSTSLSASDLTSTSDSTESTVTETNLSSASTETEVTETTEGGTTGSASESSASDITESTISETGTTESADYSTSEATESVTTESGTSVSSSSDTESSGTTEFESTATSESEPSSTESTGSDTTLSEPSTTEGSTEKESPTSESTDITESSTTEVTEGETTETTPESTVVSESSTTESSSESPETTVSESIATTETSETKSLSTESSDISSTVSKEAETDTSTESASTTAIAESSTSSGSTSETSQSSTEGDSTTEASSERSTLESLSSGSSTSDSSTSESSTSESSTSESSTLESSTAESSTSESSSSESSTLDGSTSESSTSESSTLESSTSESSTSESLSSERSSTEDQSTSERFTTEVSTSSSSDSSVTDQTTSVVTEGTEISTPSSAEDTTTDRGITPWDWTTTVETYTKKPSCKTRRKIAKCLKSKFGCCPDKRTPAAGPFDDGCPNPKTCKETRYGCCPDGVSPAHGPSNKGCPMAPCNETLFGCCLSDNVTAAEGNDQEGCPTLPKKDDALSSRFNCVEDGKTGTAKEGCVKAETEKVEEDCVSSEFGCCADNKTKAFGPEGQGCPCETTEFGCCPDGIFPAQGLQMEGCVKTCNSTTYGCCPDGKSPAHGPDFEGCCLLSPFGCCPDNYRAAEGPNLEGCSCEYSRFGCCPDNVTVAHGSSNEGCGCQYTEFGCCPDRKTAAKSAGDDACPCPTYQFGCCPDGLTPAKGPSNYGCSCQDLPYGCCGDGMTAAGPDQLGCNCANSKYGCCPDGTTEAKGEKFLGCTDIPVDPQAACSLTNDRGPCNNYTVNWYYDTEYGGCSRFWYGGCEGNGNRFASLEDCKDVCEKPSPKDACKLPKVKGACLGYYLRWYYDTEREICGQFVYGGCLGNDNNFESQELCKKQCEPERTADTCSLPIEAGPCAGTYGRWGYNTEKATCEQFIWGGCGGNDNRFSTQAACKNRCEPPGKQKPVCKLPQAEGNCTETLAVWSFNQTGNRCVPFYYTGCDGNGNRFESEQSCVESCPSEQQLDICTLPSEPGDCAEYTQRWYFDTAEERCRLFFYGGCGGNENNFLTEQECEARCTQQPSTTVTTTTTTRRPDVLSNKVATDSAFDFCFMELDPGPCDRLEPHWGYDSSLGACTIFQYGGCGGNRNNFPSQEHCEYYCAHAQDICQLPMLSGPCDESVMRWFYDPTTDACSQFTYSGCEGNGNRFESLEACERRCRTGGSEITTTSTSITTTARPPTTTEAPLTTTTPPVIEVLPQICQVSPILEECGAIGTVWYLDVGRRECLPHDNSGLGASCRRTGTFSSPEACERSCGAFRNIDVCRYPLDPGPCQSQEIKFYFDQAESRCVQFLYGGCHGGPNRFSSLDECEEICKPESDPCKQKPEPGNCLAYYLMWYYDEDRDICSQFVYGGCNGNDNRFETREQCEGRCVRNRVNTVTAASPTPETTTATITMTIPTTTTTTVAPITTTEEPVEEECRVPASLQPCGSNATVFYYDSSRRACLVGDFGNCGYQNSYRSEEECERRCGAFRGLDACGARLDPGPCGETGITKVYWDADSGRCLPFAYSGCLGGPNRFSSEQECEEICGSTGPDICLEPLSMGTSDCGQPSKRWYYNSDEDDCISFIYFGCGGNFNNFVSYDECLRLCGFQTDTNEVLPDCDAYNEECASLRCSYGVQRTRTASGCERCSCVQVEIDCEPLRLECESLKCNYGMVRNVAEDGCERCRCLDHPCASKECAEGERCVPSVFRDPVLQELSYVAGCNVVNKTGSCPSVEESPPIDTYCRTECNDDADCKGAGKCCERGCSRVCLPPAEVIATSPAPHPTTYASELPQAPQANSATEPEVTASEGGKATLRCLFHGNPPPRISWRRGEIVIDGETDRYRLLSDGALEIVSLYRNDSGVYICIADNGLGTARQEIHLVVNVPVTTRILSAPTTIAAGAQLSLSCEVDGYPEPEVYWSKDGVPLSLSDRMLITESRLMISSTNINDSGQYGCHARNSFSSHSSTVQISVEGLYIPPTCTDNPFFANCHLIVRSKYCKHKYYSKFCCRSCMEAGLLLPQDIELLVK